MEKANWVQKVNEIITGYLSRGDGCFDAEMHARLCGYSYEEQTISIEFETLKWQINERGGIHGGAIAGMFDTAFGVVANFVAGENEAATADMNVSFIRPVEYGEHPVITVYIVKKRKIHNQAQSRDVLQRKRQADRGRSRDVDTAIKERNDNI